MPKVLQIKEIEKVKAEIQNYFTVNEDARFVRRLDVIALICNGHAINYVARSLHNLQKNRCSDQDFPKLH